MNEAEKYLRVVMRKIQAPPRERARIEADLRAHIQSALEAGESPAAIVARMGSPEEVAAEFMAGVKLSYASFWRRLGAFIVDIAICAVVVVIFAGSGAALASMVPQEPQGFDYVGGAALLAIAVGFWLVAFAVYLLYFPMLEGRYGQTIGKRLLGLHVVKENGAPIGFKEAFLRRLSFYFDFLIVDGIFIFFTAKRQRAFDMIARTVVIQDAP